MFTPLTKNSKSYINITWFVRTDLDIPLLPCLTHFERLNINYPCTNCSWKGYSGHAEKKYYLYELVTIVLNECNKSRSRITISMLMYQLVVVDEERESEMAESLEVEKDKDDGEGDGQGDANKGFDDLFSTQHAVYDGSIEASPSNSGKNNFRFTARFTHNISLDLALHKK